MAEPTPASEAPSAPIDINTIPYDAPLSFPEPPSSWTSAQNRKGSKGTRVKTPENIDLRGKWVVISGSNNGIGREAAIQMASWGANLILACRDPPPKETHPTVVVEECKNAAKEAGHEETEVEWWEMDCAKLESVEAFAKRWLETGKALDLLCNNAGIGSSPGGAEVFRTADGFEIVHQVNLLSHVLLTLRLLPSIARAPAPRIICTTSCFHYLGKYDLSNFNGELGLAGTEGVHYYMNNKLWFQIWISELQARLLARPAYTHITVQGVHPGYVNSGVWNLNNKNAWWKVFFLKCAAWVLGITPQQGSLAITVAATSVDAGADPDIQGVGEKGGRGGGRYFNRVWEEEPMPHTKDSDARLRVWRKVNDELKLQEKGLLDVLGLEALE
ncbi:NAD(P)-binding protein [Saccharata proteae CBS 121410]|uniref:NAD(P)-binding protein n=1 Tax=Saccharata proteae CBS 121410 TaxID=1314787 RepID=A0A6A5YAL4_9PEZI|nr:NAD(P)-binding protein [Saccharata proteae CBS 121410]